MDRGDLLRSVLARTGADLWALIETAISVAAADHWPELRRRRDRLVERLYAPPPPGGDPEDRPPARPAAPREEAKGSSSPIEKAFGSSPLTPQSNHRQEVGDDEEGDVDIDDEDVYDPPVDQEQRKILAIKNSLEDADQSDDSIVELLETLAHMDITFKALKETDIGRHVNGLRKHPSSEVKRLVKQLVRKWKETVDEWVKANSETNSPANITDGDSPQMSVRSSQNRSQVAEFGYSPSPNPNPNSGRSSSNRSSCLDSVEHRANKATVPLPSPNPALDEKLANARRRLQANYQDAQNAKKQRTIQVMDIHEIPKPTNGFVARSKGWPQHHRR